MGIGNFFDSIMGGIGDIFTGVVDPGRHRPSNRQRQDELDWMKREIDDMKQKKEAVDKAAIGPEVGIDPARMPGEGQILVDDEGILTMRRRFELGEQMSRTPNRGEGPPMPLYNEDEEAYYDKFVSSKVGSATIKQFEAEFGSKLLQKMLESKYGTEYPKHWTTSYYIEDFQQVRQGKISYNDFVGRILETHEVHKDSRGQFAGATQKLDFEARYGLKHDIILEYRRNKTIDPKMNVPVF